MTTRKRPTLPARAIKGRPPSAPGPRSPEWRRRGDHPVLRFTPWAWAKLHFLCHRGDTEIGGFGIASADDLLLIEDFVILKQRTTAVSVSFDDEAVADFFDAQVEVGRRPAQFARYWCHTHPGDSAEPSRTDEDTFARVFGKCDWAVMFILAHGGETYARLRFNVGPEGALVIPVEVDYSVPFPASSHGTWQEDYDALVVPESRPFGSLASARLWDEDWEDGWPEELDLTSELELLDELDELESAQRLLYEDEVIE